MKDTIMYNLNKQTGEIKCLGVCQTDKISLDNGQEIEVVFYKDQDSDKWQHKILSNCYPSWMKAFHAYRDFIQDEKRNLDLKLEFLKVKGIEDGYFECRNTKGE